MRKTEAMGIEWGDGSGTGFKKLISLNPGIMKMGISPTHLLATKDAANFA
jgi:hypothetical protein